MDLPDELKSDLHQTLLGPLSLASEIFGALLPGCVFSLLLFLKGRWPVAAMSTPLLGYKTKLVAAVLASYIFGKVSLSIVDLVEELATSSVFGRKKKVQEENKETKPNALTVILTKLFAYLGQAPESTLTFLGGLNVGVAARALQHYAAHAAESQFYLSAGLVFLVAAAIPGDGHMRWAETTIGLILLARGIRTKQERGSLFAGLIGMILGEAIRGLQPGQLSKGLEVAMRVTAALANSPSVAAPTTGVTSNKSSTTERRTTEPTPESK